MIRLFRRKSRTAPRSAPRYEARYIGTGAMRRVKKAKKPPAYPLMSDHGGYDYAEFAFSDHVRVIEDKAVYNHD